SGRRSIGSVPVHVTVPINGASGPQPHRDFIEVFGEASVRGGEGEVAGAGEGSPAELLILRRYSKHHGRVVIGAQTYPTRRRILPLESGMGSMPLSERTFRQPWIR